MTIFGKNGLNFELNFKIPIIRNFDIGFNIDCYSINSLYGERHAVTVIDRKLIKKIISKGKKEYTEKKLKNNIYFGISFSYSF